MNRRGIWVVIFTTIVLLAIGASQTRAGKGGNKGGGNGGGGGSEPPVDPAIAFRVGTSSLRVVNDDGSSGTIVLTDLELGGSIGAPHWSPDGEQLLFSSTSDADGVSRIYVIDKDGSNLTALRARNVSSPGNGGLAWSPVALGDGRYKIAYGDSIALPDGSLSSSVYLMNTDGTDPVRLERATGDLSWSPDGSRLAVDRGVNGIRVHTIAVSGTGVVTVTQSPRYLFADIVADEDGWLTMPHVISVDWAKTTPDLLAVGVNPTGDSEEIWIVDLSSAVSTSQSDAFEITDAFNLTSSSGIRDLTPDWSPDDSLIVFYRSRARGAKEGLYLIASDGTGDPQRLGVDGWVINPSWRR